jgi:hypothetical protein
MKAIITPFLIAVFVYSSSLLSAQTNLDRMLQQVEAGKTYALYKATKNDQKTYKEENSFYIKVTPPIYKTVYDTIEITPALNGNLDTSNYFIQTEILVLKEPSLAWKTARVHELCREDKATPTLALCLLKTTPEYKIVNRKFFPFKNILDTTTTDYVIPAETKIVERKVLVQDTRIMRLTEERKNQIAKGEKLVKVNKGNWAAWSEVVCPYGEFNDPDIKEVQTALKKQNYKIKITGNFDAPTKEVLHQFQKDNMLKIGGLSEETLTRLGIRREPLISVDY